MFVVEKKSALCRENVNPCSNKDKNKCKHSGVRPLSNALPTSRIIVSPQLLRIFQTAEYSGMVIRGSGANTRLRPKYPQTAEKCLPPRKWDYLIGVVFVDKIRYKYPPKTEVPWLADGGYQSTNGYTRDVQADHHDDEGGCLIVSLCRMSFKMGRNHLGACISCPPK